MDVNIVFVELLYCDSRDVRILNHKQSPTAHKSAGSYCFGIKSEATASKVKQKVRDTFLV